MSLDIRFTRLAGSFVDHASNLSNKLAEKYSEQTGSLNEKIVSYLQKKNFSLDALKYPVYLDSVCKVLPIAVSFLFITRSSTLTSLSVNTAVVGAALAVTFPPEAGNTPEELIDSKPVGKITLLRGAAVATVLHGIYSGIKETYKGNLWGLFVTTLATAIVAGSFYYIARYMDNPPSEEPSSSDPTKGSALDSQSPIHESLGNLNEELSAAQQQKKAAEQERRAAEAKLREVLGRNAKK